jgi:hypothetical protein
MIDAPHKEVWRIKGFETFTNYFIDVNGNVYSTKYKNLRKLRPYWANNKENPYWRVTLCDKNGNLRKFYIHQLMRAAFIPEEMQGRYVFAGNKNRKDNSLRNLTQEYELNEDVRNEIKLIHQACIEKGLNVSDYSGFVNEVMSEMLEEYVNRKGLKKILYRLKNEQ